MAEGSITLEVKPDLSGFRSSISRETAGIGEQAGADAGHNFGAAFLGVAKVGAIAAGAGIVAALGIGGKIAADLEQSQIAFTTLFQNADTAKQFLGQLKSFAAATPFDLPGLTSASQKLAAAGISADKILPIMETLGDSIASMGGDSQQIDRATLALQQMALKGKVSGEEMLQLAEAGVPAWDALAAKLGTTVADAQDQVSKGLVDYTVLYDALGEKSGAALQRSTGAMAAQSQSFSGLMSTLKDTLGIGLAEALGPALTALKPLMQEGGAFMVIMGQVGQIIAPIGTLLVGAFQAALPAILALSGALVQIVNAVGPSIAQMATAAGPVLAQLASSIGGLFVQLAPLIGQILTAVQPLILALGSGLADVISTLAPSFTNLIKAALPLLQAIIKPLVALIPALTPVIEIIGAGLASALSDLAPALIHVVEFIGKLFDAIGPLIGQLGGQMAVQLMKLAPLFVKLIEAAIPLLDAILMPLVNIVIPQLLPVLGQLASAFLPVIDALIGVIQQIAPILVPLMIQLAHVFTDQITAMVPMIPALAQLLMAIVPLIPPLLRIVDALLPPFIVLLGISTAYLPPLANALAMVIGWLSAFIGIIAKVIDWIASLVEWIGNNLFQSLGKLVDFGDKVIHAIWDGISGALGWLQQQVFGIPDKIVSGIGNISDRMYTVGRSIVEGIWNGISSLGGWIVDKLTGWVSSHIPDPIKKALGIGSPSRYMADHIGKPIAQGIGVGFGAAIPGVAAAMAADLRGATGLLTSGAASLGLSSGLAAGSGGGLSLSVYIGETELTDIVRREVKRSDSSLATTLSGRLH